MKKLIVMGTLVFAAACGQDSGTTPTAATAAVDGQGHASPAHGAAVLIGFKSGMDAALVNKSGGAVHSTWPEINAVGAYMPLEAQAALARNPNVEYIEEDRVVQALAIAPNGEDTWGNVAVKAPEVRALGVSGAGVTVCVIDTGIDALHPEFARTPALFAQGYDYVDNDTDPSDYGCDTAGCHFGIGHGTHVTGTIAAQLGQGGLGGPSADGIVGVAPGVTLVEYRVLGLDGSGSTSGVISAIGACAKLTGKRIASLSLGSSRQSAAEKKAFDAAVKAGVLVFAAAGNDGTTGMSYPAGYDSVISVAALDAALAHATFSQSNRDVELAAPGVAVTSTVPRGLGLGAMTTVNTVAYASNALEFAASGDITGKLVNCGLCDTTTSCGAAPAGFIAYCDRGTVTFAIKVQNAQAQHAAAVIIANNDTAAPDATGTFTLGAAGTWVPSVSVSYNAGLAIKAGGFANANANVAIAPIDYATWDGTSMATPHAAACGALVWSAKPNLTAAAVRTLLNSTATDLGSTGRDNDFGYGLVNCQKAVSAP